MTKKDLVSGMFGKASDGEIFVIAGSRVIFESGTYNDIDDLNDKLEFTDCGFPCGAHIESLYEGHCFDEVRDGNAKLIWKREEAKKEVKAAKPEAKSEDAITITIDEFLKVAEKVNKEWMEVAEQKDGMNAITAMIGLQNTTFAAHLAAELFG